MTTVPVEAIAAVWAYRLRTVEHPPRLTEEQAEAIAGELRAAWPHLRAVEHRFRPLTVRQREIYDYIADSIRQRGYTPSFEEIAERMGFLSLATVHEHLTNLQKKGWIYRSFNESRAIYLAEPAA